MHISHEAALLRQKGFRLTPQRLQILHVLQTHAKHLTAEEIFTIIAPEQPSLDIATVYRTLQWLQQVDLVAPIDLGDNKLRYEYHPHGNEHDHLVCQQCGQLFEVHTAEIQQLKNTIQHKYGFAIDDHLMLPGRCGPCGATNNNVSP